MNRRRWLFALAIALPLALFIAARVAASWRPVTIGQLSKNVPTRQAKIAASRQFVIAGYGLFGTDLFDLRSGRRSSPQVEGMTENGNARWQVLTDKTAAQRKVGQRKAGQRKAGQRKAQLVVQGETAKRTYPISVALADSLASLDEESLQFWRTPRGVELVTFDEYYAWDGESGQLKSQAVFGINEAWCGLAPTPDGKRVVHATLTELQFFSTQTGKLAERIPLVAVKTAGYRPFRFSPLGSYVIYMAPLKGTGTHKFDVLQSRNGRKLWSFVESAGSGRGVIFAPDESALAIRRIKEKVWEIVDLKTGRKLRQLPLVPQTENAAFSPDGATLYSVANGILYRQRAR